MQVVSSSDGKQLAMVSNDGKLTLWDVRSREAIRELHAATGAKSYAAFSPNGRLLLAGFYDGTCGLWNTAVDNGGGGRGELAAWKITSA